MPAMASQNILPEIYRSGRQKRTNPLFPVVQMCYIILHNVFAQKGELNESDMAFCPPSVAAEGFFGKGRLLVPGDTAHVCQA